MPAPNNNWISSCFLDKTKVLRPIVVLGRISLVGVKNIVAVGTANNPRSDVGEKEEPVPVFWNAGIHYHFCTLDRRTITF